MPVARGDEERPPLVESVIWDKSLQQVLGAPLQEGQEHMLWQKNKQHFFFLGGVFKNNMASSNGFLLSVENTFIYKTLPYLLCFHQQTYLPFVISHTQLQVSFPLP